MNSKQSKKSSGAWLENTKNNVVRNTNTDEICRKLNIK